MAKKTRKPFELKLGDDERQQLALDLSRALDDALAARSASDLRVQYWHTLYEQGLTRTGRNTPWADAADLTSYLGTQYVDVMRSQIVKTVMVEPVWTVEGYGAAEKKAPFVEEFHQWQMEAEGFQQAFSRAVHLALIEPWGVMEVYEDTIKRPVRSVIKAALQLGPEGGAMLGADLQPQLQRGQDGKYVQPTDENTPSVDVEVDTFEVVCRGPRHRTLPYRDYLQLPGHAHDKSEVWGHAKRFYRRLDELNERVKAGVYDADAVEALGADDELASETTLAGEPLSLASKDGTDQVEKELWELLVLRDLDGKGLRWFVVTLHKDKRQILRLQYDDIGRPRYFPLVPFPRPNSTEGYSYVGHKLITVIEEHTAWRNMLADRARFQLQAPMAKLQTALWDPDTEPIGPNAVITMRQRGEVEPMAFPDQTSPAVERIRDCERTGERLAGINDASAGVTSQDKRTLGEVQIITEQSQGRVTEAVKNIQETLEEIAQVRHLIWKRALAEMGQEGLEAPPSVSRALSLRGATQPQSHAGVLMGEEGRAPDISQGQTNVSFTAQMMEGNFRFKPRGSVQNADPNRLRADFAQSMQSIAMLAQASPMIGAILQTPSAAKALMEQWVRLFNVQDKQAFLGSDVDAALQKMAAAGPQGQGQTGPDPRVQMQISSDRNAALIEKTRMDNETRLAVAELGAKVDRMQVFLDERARLGVQDHEAMMAAQQQGHEAGLAGQQQGHEMNLAALQAKAQADAAAAAPAPGGRA